MYIYRYTYTYMYSKLYVLGDNYVQYAYVYIWAYIHTIIIINKKKNNHK